MEQPQSQGDMMIGQIIADRYKLVRKLGEGGMGEVYEAEHIHIEKRVALKLLRAEILSNQEAVVRFRQEARSASSIGHKNIIEIDDFGTLPDGRVYMTMEFLAGAPLSDLAKAGLPLPRALDILIQTTIGLGAAHAKGIVHRDMKPDNVFVTIDSAGKDTPKILDFGIAKISGHDSAQAHLTRTGTIFGTPYYMAPEQALGQAIDHRADVYAMGVIMFEVFAGQVPFKADSFMAILTMHITAPPPAPSQVAAIYGRWVPPELEAIIGKAMQKDPKDRFQSMNELAEALQGVFRQYVGAGSTQPLAAAPATPSSFVPVPTSAAVPAQVTPMPTVPPHGHSGMLAHQPQPYNTPPVGMGAMPSHTSPPMAQPRSGGGKGLIIGLVLLLLAGGGGAGWYFLMGPGAKKGEQVAQADPKPVEPSEPSKPIDTNGTKPPVEPTDPPKDPKPPEDPKPNVPATNPSDPPVKRIRVQIESTPPGAAIYEGERLLGKTPDLIQIDEGQTLDVKLVLSGYEDDTFSFDGSESIIKRPLKRERRDRPPRDPVKPQDPVKPPDPVKLPDPVKPPKQKMCKSNPAIAATDPKCDDLE